MPKVEIKPIDLAKEYLIKRLHLDKRFVNRNLLPSLFEENFICKSVTTHNLVIKNKATDSFTQTHFHINRPFESAFSTPAELSYFLTLPRNSDPLLQEKKMRVFDSNIADLLERRKTKLSADVVPASPENSFYKHRNNLIRETSTYRGFYTQGNRAEPPTRNNTQLHIGIHDESVFKDFRLGILLDDCCILLKYANNDSVLMIAIPSEFCEKYNIVGVTRGSSVISRKKSKEEETIEDIYDNYDGSYSNTSNKSSTNAEQTSGPVDAPKGRYRKGSSKPKYTANPKYGKGALVKAGYLCEYDPGHTSFISEVTGMKYMEPHHLVPISNQADFEKSLDVTPNLICLCPNCHKKIHHGRKDEVKSMLELFYRSRKADLEIAEIRIDIETLFAYYDIF
jgi:5-methylcytosine-specific restriction endonuclease McrA